jgi:hypothetical protein
VDALTDRQVLRDLAGGDAADGPPVASDRCGGGPLLEPRDAPVVLSGTTAEATNQYGTGIRCGGSDPFSGPQRYFRVAMNANTTYRLTVQPQFEAMVYLFSACATNVINADCGSGGATGALVGPMAPGSRGSLLFFPSSSGVYILALDSRDAASAGAFELTVEAFDEPENGRCTGATALPLVDGAARVEGSTLGARDEFGGNLVCGLGLTLDGPQVYYAVDLQQGTWYRFSLVAEFAASLYVANTEGGCDSLNIEQDCAGITGTVMPAIDPGTTGVTAFSPPVAGTYLVAIDSLHSAVAGDFTLSIEAFEPASPRVCTSAASVTLTADAASVSGDTGAGFNDRGAQIACGGEPLVGPQSYYLVELQQKSYLFELDASFDAVVAVGKDCLSLPADCGSNGLDGAVLRVPAGQQGKLAFTPAAPGSHVVVVDSTRVADRGAFRLDIGLAPDPQNGSCDMPQALSVPVELPGDTGPLRNDIDGVDCGDAAGPWPGPQAYYRVSVPAGQTVRVTVAPEPTFDPALYAFPAGTTCAPAALNASCLGLSSDAPGGGTPESIDLVATAAADFIVVVDSWSPSEVGTFSLQVTTP